MNGYKEILKLIGVVALILGLLSDYSEGRERYGQEICRDVPFVKVKDIYLNPALQSRVVNLEGKIVGQCFGNGCWFFLRDETGTIFIDLKPYNLSIGTRNKIGKKVKVMGEVRRNGNYRLIGQGVRID